MSGELNIQKIARDPESYKELLESEKISDFRRGLDRVDTLCGAIAEGLQSARCSAPLEGPVSKIIWAEIHSIEDAEKSRVPDCRSKLGIALAMPNMRLLQTEFNVLVDIYARVKGVLDQIGSSK